MRSIAALVLLWWGLSAPAYAACSAPYASSQLATDLGALSSALREGEDAKFIEVAARLDAGLTCADRGLNRAVLASVYRYIGIYRYRAGNELDARRYFRIALELEPTYEFDINEMDFVDPIRAVFTAERDAAFADKVPSGSGSFSLPAGSSVLLDGRPVMKAEATLDRPHLVQVVGADQSVQKAFLIDGNQFPAELLKTEVATAAAAPTSGKPKKGSDKAAGDKKPDSKQPTTTTPAPDDYSVVKVDRVRPPAKTPLMVLGGAGVLAGGALYALSFGAANEFNAATTTDELTAARTRTNALVLGSVGALAAGVGIGYVGIILDAGPGVMIGARF